jgi:hypothetical protein
MRKLLALCITVSVIFITSCGENKELPDNTADTTIAPADVTATEAELDTTAVMSSDSIAVEDTTVE